MKKYDLKILFDKYNMLYEIRFFFDNNNKIIYANSIRECSSKINEEIIENRINCFPVSPYIIANWTSRKKPLKSTKRYSWLEIEKHKKPIS